MPRKEAVAIVAAALVAATVAASATSALEVAWGEFIDIKGCDGNWHQVVRPRDMRQCLAGREQLRCSQREIEQFCADRFGRQQNDGSVQPSPY